MYRTQSQTVLSHLLLVLIIWLLIPACVFCQQLELPKEISAIEYREQDENEDELRFVVVGDKAHGSWFEFSVPRGFLAESGVAYSITNPKPADVKEEKFSNQGSTKDLEALAFFDGNLCAIGELPIEESSNDARPSGKHVKLVQEGRDDALATYFVERVTTFNSKGNGSNTIEGLDIYGDTAIVLTEGGYFGKKNGPYQPPRLFVHKIGENSKNFQVRLSAPSMKVNDGQTKVRGTSVLLAEAINGDETVPVAIVLLQSIELREGDGKVKKEEKWLMAVSLNTAEPKSVGVPIDLMTLIKIDSDDEKRSVARLNWEGMCWMDDHIVLVNDCNKESGVETYLMKIKLDGFQKPSENFPTIDCCQFQAPLDDEKVDNSGPVAVDSVNAELEVLIGSAGDAGILRDAFNDLVELNTKSVDGVDLKDVKAWKDTLAEKVDESIAGDADLIKLLENSATSTNFSADPYSDCTSTLEYLTKLGEQSSRIRRETINALKIPVDTKNVELKQTEWFRAGQRLHILLDRLKEISAQPLAASDKVRVDKALKCYESSVADFHQTLNETIGFYTRLLSTKLYQVHAIERQLIEKLDGRYSSHVFEREAGLNAILTFATRYDSVEAKKFIVKEALEAELGFLIFEVFQRSEGNFFENLKPAVSKDNTEDEVAIRHAFILLAEIAMEHESAGVCSVLVELMDSKLADKITFHQVHPLSSKLETAKRLLDCLGSISTRDDLGTASRASINRMRTQIFGKATE